MRLDRLHPKILLVAILEREAANFAMQRRKWEPGWVRQGQKVFLQGFGCKEIEDDVVDSTALHHAVLLVPWLDQAPVYQNVEIP